MRDDPLFSKKMSIDPLTLFRLGGGKFTPCQT